MKSKENWSMESDGASLALMWNGRYIDDFQKCISQKFHTSVLIMIQDHVKESITALKKEFEEVLEFVARNRREAVARP